MATLTKYLLQILFVTCLLIGCRQPFTPKPHGYPRVDFPDRVYTTFAGVCPFTFAYPTYGLMIADTNQYSEPCWYNLYFPAFEATLHMSYKYFNKKVQVDSMMEDCYNLTTKHEIVAEGIEEREIHDSSGVQGMFYELHGNTATPFNFYLTDSKHHFFRGSFYFNGHTNRDSVAPVIDFVKADVFRIIQSFKFKN